MQVFATHHKLDDIERLEESRTAFRGTAERTFYYIRLQAEAACIDFDDETCVAVAYALQDDTLQFVVHQFITSILVAKRCSPSSVLTKIR